MPTGNTSELVVVARNLVKRYENNLAVDGIDLTIHKGEYFSLLGPIRANPHS